MYRQLIVSELREALMRLRDPRCDDSHGKAMYLVGLIQGLRLGQVLTECEICSAQALLASARIHHNSKTPWPEPAPYLPF